MTTYAASTQFNGAFQESTGCEVQSVGAYWSLGSATLGTADVLSGPIVPAGARIMGVHLAATDLSTAADITLDVGDSGDDNRLVAASTIGQAGGSTTTLALAGIGYKYTAATEIQVTPAAAAAANGGTAQAITLRVDYIVEQATS
jgi:cell division protein FtsI/penicillin-binding protein 2